MFRKAESVVRPARSRKAGADDGGDVARRRNMSATPIPRIKKEVPHSIVMRHSRAFHSCIHDIFKWPDKLSLVVQLRFCHTDF